jgi:amino acid adenylation domain-containing protein
MGALEYNTDLFKADTITRMLGHFQVLLESIVANPDRQFADLPILTAAERHQLLVEFNQNQSKLCISRQEPGNKPNPKIDRCLHHLIEAQVEQTPDAVAVIFENEQLTYRELNCRANQLAHYLQMLGVKPEVLLGICLDRSLEMVIALLGILKAGGAYVPLDPTYPKERLAFVIEETQLPVLLTQQHLRESIPQHQAHTVCIDSEWQAIALHSQENIDSGVRSENLAYTIYTSGSTGKPKGVQITHNAVVNFLTSMQQEPGLSQQDVLLAITTISFDIAALELYLPLIVSAKIVLVSREVASDGVQLSNMLASATVMQATPATWQLLLDSGWQGNKQLKMLCGGEAMTRSLAERLLQKGSSLWNMYGPTETTIWSAARKVEPGTDSVAIGCPIANTQIYLLDPHLQPVPIGVPGELYIGGAGVARGYFNRPDLTAQRFIPNPFSDRQENRLYKTGDLARYLPNGSIEYLGRIDYQVKIRGFRIELGEIETVMRQHPAVREAIAIVREQPQKSLVAYVVPNQHPAPAINDLRSFLKERLPEYMVPAAFVLLDALPLTANGKLDRRALPTPDGERPVEGTFVAANTPLEEMVAGIWVQILGLEQVGIHDNFFELGGHSLLATQAISHVRQTFQVEIPLRRLFEAPTVAELAKQIETAMQAKSELKLPIQQISRQRNLPLSFAQQRLWFLHQLDPDSTAYNGSTAVQLQGLLDRRALEQSINEVVRRHETLRTCFAVVEGRAVQKIADALTVSLPLVDLQDLPQTEREAEVLRLGRADTQQPFDLTQAPLMRLTLVQLDTAEHVLWVTMHHIISDAWSAGVFIREISALYEAFSTIKSAQLPELPIQYADFAVWQQQWLQGEILDTQLAYWKRQLDGAKTVLVPTDRPRTPFQTSRGAKHSFALSPTLSQSLKSLSQQAGVTLFMTLLAGFNALLYRYTGQEDILVGSPIANRNHSEIEGLIGFFVNTLVLRTALSNNPSFIELLQQVREVALGAYTHQDLPFEKLVAELQLERNLSHAPLFQVWFVLQNAPASTLELSGLKLSFLETEAGTVRHDLKLDLTEAAERIKGFFEYKIDLFNGTTIARMAELFERLLVLVVEEPNIKLNQLVQVLNEEENQQQILKNHELKEVRRQKLGKIGRKAVTDIV